MSCDECIKAIESAVSWRKEIIKVRLDWLVEVSQENSPPPHSGSHKTNTSPPPPPPHDITLPSLTINHTRLLGGLTIDVDLIRRAIMSFPSSSNRGTDGLLPQHLKGLTGQQKMELRVF